MKLTALLLCLMALVLAVTPRPVDAGEILRPQAFSMEEVEQLSLTETQAAAHLETIHAGGMRGGVNPIGLLSSAASVAASLYALGVL